MESTESKVKITNPLRIVRILRKICNINLQIFIRIPNLSGVVVKGKAAGLKVRDEGAQNSLPGFFINGLSERAIQNLVGQKSVTVEFVLMSSKVIFSAKVMRLKKNSMLVTIPTSLLSFERRKNARFKTTPELMGYVSLSIWNPLHEHTSAPYFSHYEKMSGWLPIADISVGGLCLATLFPAVTKSLVRGMQDEKAVLHLPMQSPIEINLRIQWVKKTKEQEGQEGGEAVYKQSIRYGCEYFEPTKEAVLSIKRYLHELTQVGTI